MLRLSATDEDDLSVISAQMQDAVLRREDMNFDGKRRRFSLIANRFAWDGLPQKQRRRAGLTFDDVVSTQVHGLDAMAAGDVLSLLAITFMKNDELSGVVTLAFSNSISIRLQVDCINATLADLGGCWGAAHVPRHGK